ncbi:S2P endopeptidase [Acrasis kona]|uniref:Endopeptidase S2P n=1 Tax=Acrasis kona TaxID=1008807 RepID=A0AAW2ZP87_9EUKA
MLSGHRTFKEFLYKYNITLSFGSLSWQTESLGEVFAKTGKRYGTKCKLWFSIGCFIGAFCSIICMLALVLHVIYFISVQLKSTEPTSETLEQQKRDATIVLLVPGVNVPVTHIPSLIISLLLSAVVHEFGHAISAASEDVRTEQIGFVFFLFLPSAYVSLSTSDLTSKPLLSKLKIFFAGIWHNIILCLVCFVLMVLFFNSSGMFPSLITTSDSGVYVRGLATNSALHKQLEPNDLIHAVNNFPITNGQSWRSSLQNIMNTNRGHLIDAQYLQTNIKNNGLSCCEEDHESLLCFNDWNDKSNKMCMTARDVLNFQTCSNTQQLSAGQYCIVPYSDDDVIDLVGIDAVGKKRIVYLGDLKNLNREVTVSDVHSKFSFLSIDALSWLLRTLNYTLALSGALAILNLAPAYNLDGDAIFGAIFEFLEFYYQYPYKKLYTRIRIFFTFMLALNILIAAYNMIKIYKQ